MSITGVLTSCKRPDLLRATLESFYRFNTARLDELIIVEDGPEVADKNLIQDYKDHCINWLCTGERVGQIAAIDYAYSHVKSEYVFHMEDDWEFYRTKFIENSLLILEQNPKCLQVWIRSEEDTMGHPVIQHEYTTKGVKWKRMAYDFDGEWHGFSFNPGLRRMHDYLSIEGYSVHGRLEPTKSLKAEKILNQIYRDREFWAAILSDNQGEGYVRHLGDGRRVNEAVKWSGQ